MLNILVSCLEVQLSPTEISFNDIWFCNVFNRPGYICHKSRHKPEIIESGLNYGCFYKYMKRKLKLEGEYLTITLLLIKDCYFSTFHVLENIQ